MGWGRARRGGGGGGAPPRPGGRRGGRGARRGPGLPGRPPALLARRSLALAAACFVALVGALALILPGDEGAPPAYATVSLDAKARASGSATAWLDEVPAGTRIRLETPGLP